jgi:SAM-dependent methyltransferase
MKTFEDFKKYLANFTPRERTISRGHPNKWLNDNDMITMNIHGYWHTIDQIQKTMKPDSVVLDVGAYPGAVPQIVRDFLQFDKKLKYCALGIGFSPDFAVEMKNYNVELLEADLDPRISGHLGRTRTIELPEESVDVIILKDVIEHFYDPLYPLLEMNRVLKKSGTLLLSTDNLTRYENAMSFFRGKSCNVPLIEGNLFYDGDWRPHFREYAKNELVQLLNWAGFSIEIHEFYEAEFGFYRKVGNELKYFDYTQIGLKNKLKGPLRYFAKSLFHHLKDNHFIVARKIIDYSSMLEKSPKLHSDFDKWMEQRSNQ